MRRLAFVPLALALLVLAAAPASADVTRSLKGQISPGASQAWVVENLAGVMKITPGSGSSVTATVTVHAESDDIASLIKVEQVVGEKGRMTLRVIYPTDKHTTFRYPANHKSEGWMAGLWGGENNLEYAGERVKVSSSKGILLYADIEVQVPARLGSGLLRECVGRIEAKGVEGTLKFDTSSGDVDLTGLKGTIAADTGSGDVNITDVKGTLDLDTGSGDLSIEGFEGDLLKGDVGSGDVTIRSGSITKVDLDTGSGDVSMKSGDVEEFLADTGSGDVTVDMGAARLRLVKASTGSGDVTLRLSPDASFEAYVDQGSGDMQNKFADATPIVKGRTVVGYKRGDGRAKIDIETGSGDFILEPGTASASKR
ncbi:MAG TPA: DUF4097 family beta strand repeat-containing protein [Candidatus Polarisedimenticolia bacterium]|nr:DUF4097 family beta strand repeat-containing protein [Candidatus Polarisedimenticolia bacterium]